MLERIQETAAYLKGKMHTHPETAIILGTGLGSDVGINPQLVYAYTKAVRKGTKLPILAKMTPNITSMLPPALKAVEEMCIRDSL